MRTWRVFGFILMALGAVTLLMGPGIQSLHTPDMQNFRMFVLIIGAVLLLSGTVLSLFSWGGPTQEHHADIHKY